jgi:hypothetical protein
MSSLARYHGRSPRYILSTEDDNLIRVAGPKQTPWEEGTEIQNVSLTGLAFTAPDDLYPLLGEVIKIQFTPPGSRQMACYGIVTRLDSIPDGKILVGVHFYKLEMPQRIVLAQGLARKFKEQQQQHRLDELLHGNKKKMQVQDIPLLIWMTTLGFIWICLMWFLIRNDWAAAYKSLAQSLNW